MIYVQYIDTKKIEIKVNVPQLNIYISLKHSTRVYCHKGSSFSGS